MSPPKPPKNIESLLCLRKPTWGEGAAKDRIKATWLGSITCNFRVNLVSEYLYYSHACFFVELPAPQGAVRGPRIIFDPVFSRRCSPSQLFGPNRYTSERCLMPYPLSLHLKALIEIPCEIKEIPEVDVIVISVRMILMQYSST